MSDADEIERQPAPPPPAAAPPEAADDDDGDEALDDFADLADVYGARTARLAAYAELLGTAVRAPRDDGRTDDDVTSAYNLAVVAILHDIRRIAGE